MFGWKSLNVRHARVNSSVFFDSQYSYTVHYFVSDFDEQDEDDKNEQVANDADTSNDDVDDLECKVTDVA